MNKKFPHALLQGILFLSHPSFSPLLSPRLPVFLFGITDLIFHTAFFVAGSGTPLNTVLLTNSIAEFFTLLLGLLMFRLPLLSVRLKCSLPEEIYKLLWVRN